jgi:N,N'-diacetyllegionaminate synthase
MIRPVFDTPQTFIIAEAGVNHNGHLDNARRLIDAAAAAGAEAVKFQLFDPEVLASNAAPMAGYQAKSDILDKNQNQLNLLQSLALKPEDFRTLKGYAEEQGILFLCSPFDEAAALFLHEELKLPCLKIGSGELTNLPFLAMLGRLNTPLILSTGMATLDEVQIAVACVQNNSPSGEKAAIALTHCVSAYPASFESLNLRACTTLAQAFPACVIGYSDHSPGIHASVAAVALGARIIEKHFTLDKNLPGPDHQASLTTVELGEMIRQIRDIENALGDGVKTPQPIELDCIQVARRSLVAAHDLPRGHRLSASDILIKRPGSGIPPSQRETLLGLQIPQSILADELFPISWAKAAMEN